MQESFINETTDILVTKCFGQAPFLKRNVELKTGCILNPPTDRWYGYSLDMGLQYSEKEENNGGVFRFNTEGDLEYVFYRVKAEINDSFTGNSAYLEMFYLNEAKISCENEDDIYENISDYKNQLYTSPLYAEYLTLVGIKEKRENVPKITVKDLDLEALVNSEGSLEQSDIVLYDSVILFKQPDIMLYNGKYVLPRDIPPLLLLEIYKLFSKKLGAKVINFRSFNNSESPISNFINTSLYNYRRDEVYLNFGSMIISMYNTDYDLYADTVVRLRTDDYNIQLLFPEGALLSDLSDMRCIAEEYTDEISEAVYMPKKIQWELLYNISKYKWRREHYFHTPLRRGKAHIKILTLKQDKKILYVYSKYSDYLKLTVEREASGSYLKKAIQTDRLPERICGLSFVEKANKAQRRKKDMEEKKTEHRLTALPSSKIR
ncbi:MAG: hypothetical protein LUD81_11385 [Clostridiales bacterium]|nr:hypothetical protein [Clostridiales bacterium]